MSGADPTLARLIDQVKSAASAKTTLDIRGGQTKAFYGGPIRGEPLDVRPLAGISSYEPSELVVTARAGTPLAELEAALAERGQCLPFEPPRFAAGGTVGGMVAAGLSGPSRAAVGSVREYVLGATMLNGRAEVLSFGGQVMKNVAGYDVSRLLVGSLGALGVICEVSLKVLPRAPAETTLRFELDEASTIHQLNQWGALPLPINASAWSDGVLTLRLCGASAAVQAATATLGGQVVDNAEARAFWSGMRDQTDAYFRHAQDALSAGLSLWRLSVRQMAAPLALAGDTLIEWGGAQRWLCSSLPSAAVRDAATAAGGHATLFRAVDKSNGAFTPLAAPVARIHDRLQQAFDPDAVFNHARLRDEAT